jgi:hypothetical protein
MLEEKISCPNSDVGGDVFIFPICYCNNNSNVPHLHLHILKHLQNPTALILRNRTAIITDPPAPGWSEGNNTNNNSKFKI